MQVSTWLSRKRHNIDLILSLKQADVKIVATSIMMRPSRVIATRNVLIITIAVKIIRKAAQNVRKLYFRLSTKYHIHIEKYGMLSFCFQ